MKLITFLKKKVKKKALVASFGHIGDGNIHINVICDAKKRNKIEGLIEPAIY